MNTQINSDPRQDRPQPLQVAAELAFLEVPASSFEFLDVPLEGAEWGEELAITTEPFVRPAGISFRATVLQRGTVRVNCENRTGAGVVVPIGTYGLEVIAK